MFDRLSEITLALARKGGGGGGSTNYNDLDHKPKINNVELAGSLSLSDLGIQEELTAGTGIDITGSTISVDADSAPTKNSQKPVTSGGTKSAIDASQNASLQMLEDTVGWTGKNLAPIKIDYVKSYNTQSGTSWSGNTLTRNGMTFEFTVDDNGYVTSITYSGTPTNDDFQVRLFDELPMGIGSYILTGASTSTARLRLSNGRTGSDVIIGHQGENPAPFTLENSDNSLRLALRIQATSAISGTIQPMIRLASVSDDTFEPYHESVEQTLRDAEVIEGKNLLPNNAKNQTINGVTFTVNADGSVTANGTATAQIYFGIIYNSAPISLKPGDYLFSGCTNGDNDTYFIYLTDTNGSHTNYNGSNNYVVNNNTGNIVCTISVRNGVTLNNVTFYPMIRKATETDPTYKPYYVPLKDVIPTKANNSALAPIENGSTASQAYAQGAYFMHNGQFCTAKTAIASGATLVENSNYTVGDVASELDTVIDACTNLPEGVNPTNNKLVKCGKVVTLYFVSSGITKGAWTTFMNIPEGFRPAYNFKVLDSNNNNRVYVLFSDGYIQCSSALESSSVEIYATWVVI